MVYQQCGPSCPQTCDTNDDTDCGGGCVEGCFCPTGQVLSKGSCIDVSDCQGTNVHACTTYPKLLFANFNNLSCPLV